MSDARAHRLGPGRGQRAGHERGGETVERRLQQAHRPVAPREHHGGGGTAHRARAQARHQKSGPARIGLPAVPCQGAEQRKPCSHGADARQGGGHRAAQPGCCAMVSMPVRSSRPSWGAIPPVRRRERGPAASTSVRPRHALHQLVDARQRHEDRRPRRRPAQRLRMPEMAIRSMSPSALSAAIAQTIRSLSFALAANAFCSCRGADAWAVDDQRR